MPTRTVSAVSAGSTSSTDGTRPADERLHWPTRALEWTVRRRSGQKAGAPVNVVKIGPAVVPNVGERHNQAHNLQLDGPAAAVKDAAVTRQRQEDVQAAGDRRGGAELFGEGERRDIEHQRERVLDLLRHKGHSPATFGRFPG